MAGITLNKTAVFIGLAFLGLVSLLAIGLRGDELSAREEVRVMAPGEFYEKMKSDPDSYTLLDVRRPEGRILHHPVNSVNIELGHLADDSHLAELSRANTIGIICSDRAHQEGAYLILKQKGYRNVFVIEGGLPAWKSAGLPIAKSDSQVLREKALQIVQLGKELEAEAGPDRVGH